MDKTSVMVEFSIIGDYFDPTTITEELIMEPTKYYLKGDKSEGNIETKETCWYINTNYIETLYVSDAINIVLKELEDKKDKLKDLKERFDLTYKFFIVIRIEQGRAPAIYLDSEIINFANYVGAEIDFDLFIFS